MTLKDNYNAAVRSGWRWRIIILQWNKLSIQLNVPLSVVTYVVTWRALFIESPSHIAYTLLRPCFFVIILPKDFNSLHSNMYKLTSTMEARGSAVGWGIELQAGFDSRCCHWNFFLTYYFRPHYGPGVDTTSNRNEYHEYLLGLKSGRCVGLTNLPHPCADRIETWVHQTSGSLMACPGIALLLLWVHSNTDVECKVMLQAAGRLLL